MADTDSARSYLPELPKFAAYVDEAGHGSDPHREFLCMAGLLARESAWIDFDLRWREVCSDEGLTESFHMMELAAFKGQFKGWTETRRRRLLGKLLLAIKRAMVIPVGSVVSVTDYNAFSPTLRRQFRDPYFVAFQPLTYNIAVAASFEIPSAPATMIYAHHPEHSRGKASNQALWQVIRKHNPIVSVFMEAFFSGKPKDTTPLQAADLWAYELGHHFEVIRPAKMRPRWPFRQFVEMGLNYSFTHDFITLTDAKGLNGVGLMSRVQRWKEISLYSPGLVSAIPYR